MRKLVEAIGYILMVSLLLLAILLLSGVVELPGPARVVLGKGPSAGVRGLPDVASAVETVASERAIELATAVPAVVPVLTPVFVATMTPVAASQAEAERGFLASCALKQARGRRVSPRCPANAGEWLGVGR